MLKIECPDCNEWVSLPFDIDLKETSCPKCAGTIKVKDVYVSAGPYTIHRDVLIKNMHRYKKLLSEAEREFEDVGGGRKADVTAKSVQMFILHLKEMLSGCRESTRYPVSGEVTAKIKINNMVFQGKVLNLSVSGLCLDASDSPALILTDDLEIILSCGEDSDIPVSGRVAWSDKKGVLGIKFIGLSAKARKALEAWITENSVTLKPRK